MPRVTGAAKADLTEDREFVASLEKGLSIIEAFSAEQPRLTLSEVAKITATTRAAARRYLRTLARLNYAEYDGRYFSLKPRILRLGYAYLGSTPLVARLQPLLEQVTEQTGESSSAAILEGDEVVYIARSATRRIMSIGLAVGSRLPAYCTSLGRAILAYQPEAETQAYLARVRLDRLTARTVVDKAQLTAALCKVRTQGYAVVDEELELGLRSMAVPVISKSGTVKIAINVSTHASRVSVAKMEQRFLGALQAASEVIRYSI